MAEMSNLSGDKRRSTLPCLSRPLGPLETMYHLYHRRGVDLIIQLVSLATFAPVTPIIVKQALVYLMKKHPILRMCINEIRTDTYPRYCFTEMDPCKLDLRETENINYEEVLREGLSVPFDYENGPLWRIVLVRSDQIYIKTADTRLKHSLVFAFSCHHSIADGMYLQKIYTDFIELVYLIQTGNFSTISSLKKSFFLPPIENILPVIFPDQTKRSSRGKKFSNNFTLNTVKRSSLDNNALALEAYHRQFHSEILSLSRKVPTTETVRFKFTEQHSRTFLLNNKENQVTVTSSCITAACMSMAQLLEPSIPKDTDKLVVPVEIMVNLRRYVTDKTMFEDYPGCAAIHIPLRITVPLRCSQKSLTDTFWNVSRQCSEEIANIVSSGKPIEIMKEEAENELNQHVIKGKSPFVICLTNLSKVDDMVKPELQENFKLVSFPSLTRIAIDDMPIFFINVFTLNKELNVNIGYCDSYTSTKTAAKYAWLFNNSICHQSRL